MGEKDRTQAIEILEKSPETIQVGAGNESALPETEQTDEIILAEKTTQDRDRLELEIEELRNRIDRASDTHDLRKTYIPKLYRLCLGWLAIVVLFVFMSGYSGDLLNSPDCKLNCHRFKLDDNVIIAFITSTTASVIGLFHYVAKWLYPSGDGKSEKKKRSRDTCVWRTR